MGAARTRHSLRPLISEGGLHNSSGALRVAGMQSYVLASLRAKRSNPALNMPSYGLLRFARNDGVKNM
jgi:hypothetical protein